MFLEMKVMNASQGALPYRSDGSPPPLPGERFTILIKFDNVSFAMMTKNVPKSALHIY